MRCASHVPKWPPIMAAGVSAPTGAPKPIPNMEPTTNTIPLRWLSWPPCSATPSMMWPMAASLAGRLR